METLTKQGIWEACISTEVTGLATESPGAREEYHKLYRYLAQGPGDWNMRQFYRTIILESDSRIQNIQY